MGGRLIISDGGKDRVHELLDDVTTVGNGDAHVRVRDAKASPLHCEIRSTPFGYKVIDLESREGTAVNGRPVNQHLLTNGDTITIAGARITFLGDSAHVPSAPKPVPKPLEVIPVDETGQPRRFYRHETPSRRPNTDSPMIVVITLAVLVGGAATWWLIASRQRAENVELFEQAERLLHRHASERDIQDAMDMVDRLDEAHLDPKEVVRIRALAREELVRYRAHEAELREGVDWDRFSEALRDHPEDRDRILDLGTKFLQRYPSSTLIGEVRRRMTETSLGFNPDDAFEALMKSASSVADRAAFADALKLIEVTEADPVKKRAFGDRLDKLRGQIMARLAEWVRTKTLAAQAAVDAGDGAQARMIYKEIAETGIDPYADAARRALEAIPH